MVAGPIADRTDSFQKGVTEASHWWGEAPDDSRQAHGKFEIRNRRWNPRRFTATTDGTKTSLHDRIRTQRFGDDGDKVLEAERFG